MVEMYRATSRELESRVAVKIHSGEQGNTNFLGPDFWRPVVEVVDGTIIECNTAYGDRFGGVRVNTESHLKLLEEHGWTDGFRVDLMDAEGPDVRWEIPDGRVL